MLSGIISALPVRMESTLHNHRNKLLGTLPKSRDEFDPLSLLSKLEGGEKILVLDSNKDLSKDWRTMDMMEAFGLQSKDDNGHPNLFSIDGVSSDGGTSNAATCCV